MSPDAKTAPDPKVVERLTIFKMRAPGMTLNRIPLFVWSMLVTSFMVIFAMPAVVSSSTFLLLDRLVGTHFYNPAEGGDSVLYQHLFWFFGTPRSTSSFCRRSAWCR